jgi:hypothetical protein
MKMKMQQTDIPLLLTFVLFFFLAALIGMCRVARFLGDRPYMAD